MKFKDNLEKTIEMYDAFWNMSNERCLLSLISAKKNYQFPQKPTDNSKIWLDSDCRIEFFKKQTNGLNFHAEAMPMFFCNFGPGVLAEYVGSSYDYDNTTGWFDRNPLIKNINNRNRLNLNFESFLFKKTEELRKKAIENNFYQAMTDLGGSLDIVAALCGTENLLTDMIEYPEEVKKLTDEVDKCWIKTFTYFAKKDIIEQGYVTNWMELYCKEPWYPLQEDVSVNFSPKMFEEFALPSLCRQASSMKKVVYHLDGDGEIKHLDQILAIDNLHSVEVTALPKPNGGLNVADKLWWPVYEKIQKAGKGLIIVMTDTDDLKLLIQNLDHKGLWLSAFIDEKDANDIISFAEK